MEQGPKTCACCPVPFDKIFLHGNIFNQANVASEPNAYLLSEGNNECNTQTQNYM